LVRLVVLGNYTKKKVSPPVHAVIRALACFSFFPSLLLFFWLAAKKNGMVTDGLNFNLLVFFLGFVLVRSSSGRRPVGRSWEWKWKWKWKWKWMNGWVWVWVWVWVPLGGWFFSCGLVTDAAVL
jgi:hypothetical protein